MLVFVGCWLLVVACCLLVVGCWLLLVVVGCWLLVVVVGVVVVVCPTTHVCLVNNKLDHPVDNPVVEMTYRMILLNHRMPSCNPVFVSNPVDRYPPTLEACWSASNKMILITDIRSTSI